MFSYKVSFLLNFVGSLGVVSRAGLTSFKDNIINNNANKIIAL